MYFSYLNNVSVDLNKKCLPYLFRNGLDASGLSAIFIIFAVTWEFAFSIASIPVLLS